MKRLAVIIVILSCVLANAESKAELMQRTDIIIGYAEDYSPKPARNKAITELSKEVTKWYLQEHELTSKVSYGIQDQLNRMTDIWLKSFRDELSDETHPNYSIIYIKKTDIANKYDELIDTIKGKILTALEAEHLNKTGIYLRNLYWALILTYLVPGEEIVVNEEVWDYDNIVGKISYVVENIVVRLKSNEYNSGLRRMIFDILLDERPVNDMRIGFVIDDKVYGYSVEDRSLQADLFGMEYAEMSNINIKIDLQDELTWVWGDMIREIGEITGMSGFEAYRTIPLRNVKKDYNSWDETEFESVGDETSQEELEKNIKGLLENIEYRELKNRDIYSSESSRYETEFLFSKLKISNLLTRDKIRYEETGTSRYWRGIRIAVNFLDRVTANCNLVVKTDRRNRISGVWIGMKPVDYFIARNNWKNEENVFLFLEAVEEMEKTYTENLMGRNLSEFDERLKQSVAGWRWGEIENVKITESENAAIYDFRVILSGENRSWSHKYNGIIEE